MRGPVGQKRQCARFGCTAVAAATFTFDSVACTVWLDTPFDDGARAGELCTRHAALLTPPRGWRIEDRRKAPDRRADDDHVLATDEHERPTEAHLPATDEPTPEPGDHGSGVHDRRDPGLVAVDRAPSPGARGPVRQLAAGPSDVQLEAELKGLLDAHSPLLARAFRSSGTV